MKYNSVFIYYISGTGNAKATAGWIAEEVSKEGLPVIVQKIDRLGNLNFPGKSNNNLIGFVYPTHGFNAAPIMLRFIAHFPAGLCRNIFLMNTRAGMKLSKVFLPGLSGLALVLPAFILFTKGYRCTGMGWVDLPSNWISLHPGLKENVIKSIYNRCENIVKVSAKRILSGKKVLRGLTTLPVDLLISPLAVGYYFCGRYFLAKTFFTNSRCNNCGLCLRECPTASIRITDGLPFWKLTCESCMRCMNTCPEKAIETAHGVALLFWLVFSFISPFIYVSMMNAMNFTPGSWLWRILKDIAGFVVLILVAAGTYRVFHFLMRFSLMKKLISFISLTALPFWRRYKP